MDHENSSPAPRRRPPWVLALLLRTGLTAPARALGPHVAARGWRAQVTWRGLRLTQGSRVIWLRLEDIYQVLLNFEAIARRAVFVPRGELQVADLRGEAQYLVPQTGDRVWLRKPVELHELVEGYETRGRPEAGELVFDAGAYRGEFSLVAARRVGPQGRVIAFEPDEGNRRALERTLRENGVGNVTVCPCGLWSETTTLEFAARGDAAACVAALNRRGGAAPRVRVPVLGWAEAVARFGDPAFVKMDIEGAELEVIESAGAWIERHAARFAIASYHVRDGGPTSARLEPMFRARGYMAETGFPQHVTTWAWRG